MSKKTKWVLFTKRTNEPKLSYLEARLDQAEIKHKREGKSFHAPCLYIEEQGQDRAWAILSEKWTRHGSAMGHNPRAKTELDEIRDDDPRFAPYSSDWSGFWSAHNEPGSLAEFDRYIAGDR